MSKIQSPLVERVGKLQTPSKRFCGDIVYGGEPYVAAIDIPLAINWKLRKPFFLSGLEGFPWMVLAQQIGCSNAEEVAKTFVYECPWTENQYTGFVPMAIETDDLEKFRPLIPEWREYLLDVDFMKKGYKSRPYAMDGIAQSFAGHGYESGTLPMDGDHRLALAAINFENGDRLIGWLWLWFNK